MNFTFLSSIKGYFTLLVIIIMTATNIQAQNVNQEITISPTTLTLRNIIDQVQKQTSFRFVYSKTNIPVDKTITLNHSALTVDQLLAQISSKTKLRVERSGNQLIITASENGTVKGTIRTKEDQPDAFVTVRIKGLRNTQTDSEGNFSFKNVPVGDYTIGISHVGRSAQNKQIYVAADEATTVNFIVSSSSTDLNEVIVNGNKTNKFAEKESDHVAKMALKNLENPQVYNTVNSTLLKEQLTVNMSQALTNVAGAVPSITPRGENTITLRGFSSNIGARNGIQYIAGGRTSVDPVNIERIEVLKGPSATLFGNAVSSYGGAINIVTKKPFETAASELSYAIGSWGLNRVTADVNTPLNVDKTALFRINAALNKEESFLNTGHRNTFTVAPSFTYRINDKLMISMDVEIAREDLIRTSSLRFDVLNLTNVNQIPLPYRQTLFADDFNAIANTFRTFFEVRYQISDNWTSSTNISFNNEKVEKSYQNESYFISADSIQRAMRVFGPYTTINSNIQHNLKGDFKVGNIRNRVIWGVDYTRETQDRYTARGVGDVISIREPFQLFTKVQADRVIGVPYGYSYKVSRYATYGSDLINITDRLMALLSLRLDHYVRETSEGGTDSYKQTSVTPKLGLIYQPVKDQVSLFANYMSGFTNMGPATQPDGSILTLKPEYGIQWESGVKVNTLNNKLSATLSYYNINVRDAVRIDAQQYTFQDGKQKSKGFDLSLNANPIAGLNLIAGYAYNVNKYMRTESGAENDIISNPRNVANFWLSYKFQPGSALHNFGAGFGGNYVQKSYYNEDNTVIIPSYTLFNASLFFDQAKWRFGLASNNIGNQKYWSSSNPQPLRQLILSSSFRF